MHTRMYAVSLCTYEGIQEKTACIHEEKGRKREKTNNTTISPSRKFHQNDQFFNSFTMYSNSSSYNSSYMDSIDSQIPPIDFKLGE